MKQQNTYTRAVARFDSLLLASHNEVALNKTGLARAADVPVPTAHRYLAALERDQILSRDIHGDYVRGSVGWTIAFSAWGYGDVALFGPPILRYVRAQTQRTAFWGLQRQQGLQVGAYLAGRSATFRRPEGRGFYKYSSNTLTSNGNFSYLQAVDEAGKVQILGVHRVACRGDAELVVGILTDEMSPLRAQAAMRTLSQAVQRVRSGLAAGNPRCGPTDP